MKYPNISCYYPNLFFGIFWQLWKLISKNHSFLVLSVLFLTNSVNFPYFCLHLQTHLMILFFIIKKEIIPYYFLIFEFINILEISLMLLSTPYIWVILEMDIKEFYLHSMEVYRSSFLVFWLIFMPFSINYPCYNAFLMIILQDMEKLENRDL